LEHHGAIVIGKCNQDEFAMGSSSETSCFKPTKNPWSLEHVPGGSSGGSAAAVAASLAPISIGTDTGGSIRQPANFCGVFGLKPTYGRISRYGVVAFASSFDQAGPITRRVEDARTVLNVMIGKDNKDATSLPTKPVGEISGKQRLKIAKLKNFYETELDPQVAKRHEEVIQYLKSMGHEILEVSVDHLETSVECYYLLAMSEASSNLSRYDGIRFGYRSNFEKALPKNVEEFYIRNRTEGFGSEVKRRIAIGAYALSSGYFDAYFKQAAKVRRLIQNSFVSAFTKCDLIISPVTNEPAFKLGEKSTDPLKMYNNDAFTTCVNLAGLPAASVPIGWTQEKLPVGLQVIAAPFEEDKIFKVASQVENHMKTYEVWPHV
jgi:aspartyl-tRNA(Asn)/glutamyl-tRNA(Gln) amidotransferase subunit A